MRGKLTDVARSGLEAILDVLADGITVHDPEGQLVYANHAAAKLVGFPSAEALLAAATEDTARRIVLLDDVGEPLPPEPRPGGYPLRGQTTEEVIVHFRLSGTGGERWSLVTSVPVRDGCGAVKFEVRTSRDITERMRLLRESQAVIRVRNQVLSAVSHDLRTPLTTIRGVTQLLLRRGGQIAGRVDEQVSKRLGLVDRAAGQLEAMIQEILDFARLEEGRALQLNLEALDLLALVRRVAAEQQAATDEQRLQVVASLDELRGWWDAARLERVVSKLIANAMHYSPAGADITVSVARRPREGGTGSSAEVMVRDRGAGIATADLPHIFESGRPTRETAVRSRGGRLNLAGCRQIAEQLGGSLTAESDEGAGSTFTLLLPLNEAEPRG